MLHLGEFAALGAALCWTTGSMSFEFAGKRVGSLSVNLIRMVSGVLLLSIFTYFTRGKFLPTDASLHSWIWLSLSGLIGYGIGDLLLFEAFVVVGARISMLIMSSVPIFTALISLVFLGETMSIIEISGMFLTLIGIVIVILNRKKKDDSEEKKKKYLLGILLAFGGSLGQAIGLILSKFGMQDYNAFSASQIRGFVGIIVFTILFMIFGKKKNLQKSFTNVKTMIAINVGAISGPFLGVSMSLLAVQNTKAGVASTIMAIVPLLIIPPAIIFFKEEVNLIEIVGAVIAVFGVVLFFV
ncbi:MAG: DMT family transporter [Candidatus Marinimicrobia bacterium]|nr:DMT family transporter [Candidatus Neomarinimicrobiota bacterium]